MIYDEMIWKLSDMDARELVFQISEEVLHLINPC